MLRESKSKYLGFIIDEKEIRPNTDMGEVIWAMPEPGTVREVRGFIGVIGYYRRFVPAFLRIATPLRLDEEIPSVQLDGGLSAFL